MQWGAQRAHGKQSMKESQWREGHVATPGEPHVLSIAQPAQADYNSQNI
jgi:hypothetical protein